MSHWLDGRFFIWRFEGGGGSVGWPAAMISSGSWHKVGRAGWAQCTGTSWQAPLALDGGEALGTLGVVEGVPLGEAATTAEAHFAALVVDGGFEGLVAGGLHGAAVVEKTCVCGARARDGAADEECGKPENRNEKHDWTRRTGEGGVHGRRIGRQSEGKGKRQSEKEVGFFLTALCGEGGDFCRNLAQNHPYRLVARVCVSRIDSLDERPVRGSFCGCPVCERLMPERDARGTTHTHLSLLV